MPVRPRVLVLTILGFAAMAAGVTFFVRNAPMQLSPKERPLEVKELIEAVSQQLAEVDASRRNKKMLPLFALRDFEMEINYVVRNAGGAKAEVVGIGTNLDTVSERVQKLRLRWDAVPAQKSEIPPSIDMSAIEQSTPTTVITANDGPCSAAQRSAGKC